MSVKYSHRAVAVIISHLLLIAITVMGGILLFVFVQGFFQDIPLQEVQIEFVEIIGYNATDNGANKLGTHAGIEVTVDATQNNYLTNDEDFFIFIRNSGGHEALISEIKVMGIKFTADTDSSTSDNLDAAPHEWILSTNGRDPCQCQTILSGQEGTISIGWDEEVNGKIKFGNSIHVNILTAGGFSFSKYIVVGIDKS